MQLQLRELESAGLACQLVGTEKAFEKPDRMMILCHGFGAPGTDLVPCGGEIIAADPENLERALIAFPAAPILLDEYLGEAGFGDGRAWWPIDMEKLQMAMATGNIRDMRNDAPEMLPERRTEILKLIEEFQSQYGLGAGDFVLGGFSQGSMLATEVALHMKPAPAGLVIWSGTLLNEENWKSAANDREESEIFPIVQTHGKIDPILPMVAAEWLKDLLGAAGFQVQFHEFNGPHTIPREGIEMAVKLLKEVN